MRFADIVGQEEVKAMLRRGVAEGRVSHAQLFAGESGYGTLPLALAYAQYLNCTNRHDGDSCGVCPACVKMAGLVHPDLHFVLPTNVTKSGSQKPLGDVFLPQWRELVAETGGYFDERMWYDRIGLDNQQGMIAKREADEVIRKLSFKAFEGTYKTVLIWLPEKMGAEAANGLLKILEEPWERTLFLLVSVTPQLLLPTIRSRVQEVTVLPIDADAEERWLAAGGTDARKAAGLARLSGGDLITLRRLAARDGEEGADEDFDRFTSLMRFCYNNRHLELFGWAEAVAATGREAQKRFLRYAVALLRESYMLTAGMENISYLWGAELEFCRKFAPFVGNGNIEPLVEECRLALAHIVQNGNAKLVFTHFALSVSKLIGRRQV